MTEAGRTAVYDKNLRIEAYRLVNYAQGFPRHFHSHYGIGLVERGRRRMECGDECFDVDVGSLLFFNPGDSHACVQSDGGALDYCGLNIQAEVMLDLCEELTSQRMLPRFAPSMICDDEAAGALRLLHGMLMAGDTELFCREEQLYVLMDLLLERYGSLEPQREPEDCGTEIERACAFIHAHCGEHIRLEDICRSAGMSKSSLLRAFAREKGVTPHCYLENVRIEMARNLLEQGVPVAETALKAGFSDQSHFTNCYARFIGLTPGVYRQMFTGAQRGTEEDSRHG